MNLGSSIGCMYYYHVRVVGKLRHRTVTWFAIATHEVGPAPPSSLQPIIAAWPYKLQQGRYILPAVNTPGVMRLLVSHISDALCV